MGYPQGSMECWEYQGILQKPCQVVLYTGSQQPKTWHFGSHCPFSIPPPCIVTHAFLGPNGLFLEGQQKKVLGTILMVSF